MRKNQSAFIVKIVLFILFLGSTIGVSAQKENKKDKEQSKDSLNKGYKDYAKLLKDATVTKGLFSVIKTDTDYYFEIPDSLFTREFLIVNKISQVPLAINEHGLNKGMNYENKLITFHKDSLSKTIWVKTSNPMVSSPKNDAITLSVKDNFAESIIEKFDIESYNPKTNAPLIKVNKVFNGKEKSFNDVLNNVGLGGSVKSDLSYIQKIKSFPENVVVKSQLTTTVNEGGPAMYVTLGVTSNIVLLPKIPMQARELDKRVGYFTEKHWYFNDKQQAMKKQEFITRWRLEPKPEDVDRYLSGKLVEPKKPIVYYIDPATPKQWRSYIIQGVKDWQVTFEKAGFKNAIIAKEPDANDKDFDIDDVRYSVITYAASPQANAMGPSVVDPRSGEIIEADIIWWHNVMTSLQSWMRIQTGPIDSKSRGNVFNDAHMGEAIRFVSSHEVGHTFGLKHNMGASHSFPVDSLRSKTFTDKMGGTAPSIMDYARYNYVAQPEDNVTAITPKIGVYDTYAIQWGYQWFKSPLEEKKQLKALVNSHANNPLYFYGEQQPYLNTIDPRSQSEDLGDNSMTASTYGLKNLQRVADNLEEWTYQEGDDYYNTGKLYMGIIGQWNMYNDHVTNNVGGIYLNNTLHKDGKQSYQPVPYQLQKDAVAYLNKNVFTIPEWLFFNPVLKHTYAIKDSPLGPFEQAPYTLSRSLQYNTLYKLLSNERLLRMVETNLYNPEHQARYTVQDLFTDLRSHIFKSTKKGVSLTLVERMTQKNYVDVLLIDTQKILEKTTVKKLNTANFFTTTSFCAVALAEEKQARNINYSSMTRTSEIASYKRQELQNVLQLLLKKKRKGDANTQAHYNDLIYRIKNTLKF
ncbi:metalloprotease [Cellulophaga lytica]|uniref:zinc-dependent metalloprotease n=1 Tax=Cellulophaga lytica TaxID=979 RepID=UPI0009507B43|nr:zinc-dependent metalloprotease [Cellulophaga lytica]APU10173.1 metalloprotease [Cellulophaga lytica]